MKAKIEKSTANGTVIAPPSKSMAHRLLIGAALCDGESIVRGISSCDDVLATIDCLRALGAKIEYDGNDAKVFGINPRTSAPLDSLCARESGSTLRFIIPIALLSENYTEFTGAKRLLERPMSVYQRLCDEFGYEYKQDDKGGQDRMSLFLFLPASHDKFIFVIFLIIKDIFGILLHNVPPCLNFDNIIERKNRKSKTVSRLAHCFSLVPMI